MRAASSTGASNRVRMQNIPVGRSLNWAFSKMLAPRARSPSATLATMPGRSGHTSVKMWLAMYGRSL